MVAYCMTEAPYFNNRCDGAWREALLCVVAVGWMHEQPCRHDPSRTATATVVCIVYLLDAAGRTPPTGLLTMAAYCSSMISSKMCKKFFTYSNRASEIGWNGWGGENRDFQADLLIFPDCRPCGKAEFLFTCHSLWVEECGREKEREEIACHCS